VLLVAIAFAAAGMRGRNAPSSGHRTVVGLMPKAKGDPYFVSCRKGAEEAAKALGVDLIWDGLPSSIRPSRTKWSKAGLRKAST